MSGLIYENYDEYFLLENVMTVAKFIESFLFITYPIRGRGVVVGGWGGWILSQHVRLYIVRL